MDMIGKMLVGFAVACLSTSSFAHQYVRTSGYKGESVPIPTVSTFDGFYAGASIGADNNFFTFHDTYGHLIDQGEVSPLAEIFAGYGRTLFQQYYLGGEVYLNHTIGDASMNTNILDGGGIGTHVRNEMRDSIGFSLLPGLLLTENTLGYGRIGAVWTNYHTTVTTATASGATNARKIGIELGVGLRTHLTNNWDARLEYSHAIYSSYKTTFGGYNMTVLADRVNLGLVYRLG